MKTCPRCNRRLELRDFRVDRQRPDGRETVCAECKRAEYARRMAQQRGPGYVYQPKNKLPDYYVVKALYMSGATYPEISKLYHVQRTSVQAFLKRQARRRGDPWPFDRPRFPRRNDRLVDAAIIADLIREAIKEQGISPNRWSLDHDVGPSTVSMLLRTPVRLRLYSAKRLLVALGEPVPPWIETMLRRDSQKKPVDSGVSNATDSEQARNLEQ